MLLVCWLRSVKLQDVPMMYKTFFHDDFPADVALPILASDLTRPSERAYLRDGVLYAPPHILQPAKDAAQCWMAYIPAAAAGYVIGKDGEGVKYVLATCGTHVCVQSLNVYDSHTLVKIVLRRMHHGFVPQTYASVQDAWHHALVLVGQRLQRLYDCMSAGAKSRTGTGELPLPSSTE